MNLPLGEPHRLSRYRARAALAERYRDGRVLLAGDAAHQFPATGIGLNAGLLDSINLGWKLAAQIHGWAPDGLLDTYHDERHLAGSRMMLQARAQAALRRPQDPDAEALRQVLQELFADEQPVRRIGAWVGGTDVRYPMPNPNLHPLTGTFVPDLPLVTDGGGASLDTLMRPGRPVLLDLADRADLRAIAEAWCPRIDIHTATTDDRPADALLIRPDAHIAWAATLDQPADTAASELHAALTHWFGASVIPAGSWPGSTAHL